MRIRTYLISVLLLLAPGVVCAEFHPSGIEDIDRIRKEIRIAPTTKADYVSRRAAFSRWWRLLWHQGFDMSACSEKAEYLSLFKPDAEWAPATLDAAYAILEKIQENPQRIPEIQGKPGWSGSETDWPMYLSTDGRNTGFSPDPGPSTGKIAWRFPKHYEWNARPVLRDGRIYVSAPGADVIGFCLDERSGEILWRARQYGFDLYNEWGSFQDPVVSDNGVLIRSGFDGIKNLVVDRSTGQQIQNPQGAAKTLMVYAFPRKVCVADAETGRFLWDYKLPAEAVGDPVLVGDAVFAAVRDGTVLRIDTTTRKAVWRKKLPASLLGGLSVHAGRLSVGSADGQLFCLNVEDGRVRWSWQCGEKEERALQFFSTPREHAGRLYVGAASGTLYCLNASKGSLLWKIDVGSWIRSRPLVIKDTVYVATLDSELVAVKDLGKTAREKGRTKLGVHGFTADLVGNAERILCSGKDMMLYSVSPDSGKLQWRHGIIDGAWIDEEFVAAEWVVGFMASPSVVDGTLYISGPDGFVNAVDAETGREKWRFEVGGSLSGQPVVAEGMVFVACMKGQKRFCALDQKTGRLIWESAAFGNVWVAPAYHDGMLFFGNIAGDMFGVRAADGKKIWSYYTATDTPLEKIPRRSSFVHGFPPGVYSNPAVDEQNVYVGSWAGYYFAFDQKSGQLRWRTETKDKEGGLPDSAAPMLHRNHLYVQKAGRMITALHKDTGEVKWEWEAPVGYLQNGTVAAHGNKIFGSIVRGVTTLPYHARIIAFHDVESGSQKLWEYEGGGGLTAPVATAGKLIFGSSADMFVTCLHPDTGKIIWRTFTGGEMLENVPALYGNKVFLQGKNGWVFAIE